MDRIAKANQGDTLGQKIRDCLDRLDPPRPQLGDDTAMTPEFLRACEYIQSANDEGERREAVRLFREALALRQSLTARTDWTGEPPPREWLIPKWLAAGRVALLTGRAGRGKSWLTAHLAAAVAAGRRGWLQHGRQLPGDDTPELVDVGPSVAVLASWEDEDDELHRRLLAIGRGGIDDRLHHMDLAGRGPLWADDGNTRAGEALREYCEHHDARLLVLDPLAGAFAGDEIARSSVRYFMSDWDAWARRTDCTVLMVGHPPKSDDDYSGSTDWLAAARGLLVLAPVKVDRKEKRIVEDSSGEDLPNSVYALVARKVSYGPKPADRLYLRRTAKGTWETTVAPGGGTNPAPVGDDEELGDIE